MSRRLPLRRPKCVLLAAQAMLVGVVALAAVPLASCLGDRCSPGFQLVGDECVEVAVDGGDQEDAATADAGTIQDGLTGLGSSCDSHAACPPEVEYCVIRPPATVGYCSVRDCDMDNDDCPAGYYCFDVSVFAPGEPTICVEE